MSETTTAEPEPLQRLGRDLKAAAKTLTPDEARYLVDYYYQLQRDRIRATNQVRALSESREPHEVIAWLGANTATLERNIATALGVYSQTQEVGRWAQSQYGIGPILSAGLLAHIDIEKAPTVGHIWRFAGLDPTMKWLGVEGAKKLLGEVMETVTPDAPPEEEDLYALNADEIAELSALLPEGQKQQITGRQLMAVSRMTGRKFGNLLRLATDKEGRVTRTSLLRLLSLRPWNARLKVLTWKIGESFVKVSGKPESMYGRLYVERKAQEIERNEGGVFAEQAAEALRVKRYGKETDAYAAYSQGKLPPAHVHARAKRYAVKIFLAHWQTVAYYSRFKAMPPKPYAIAQLGHAHEIQVPDWPYV